MGLIRKSQGRIQPYMDANGKIFWKIQSKYLENVGGMRKDSYFKT
jgi:hypothetical protein